MLSSTEASQVPVEVSIEILESGIAQKCARPEGQELVEAVASVFQKASLVGCEKVSGSLNDRMIIKATTLLFRNKPEEPKTSGYVLDFEAAHLQDGLRSVFIRFDLEKYELLKKRLRQVNSMASIKLEDASISVVLNNDLREPIVTVFSRGSFIDGRPADQAYQIPLNPRQEAILRLGDVKLAYLAQSGSALLFGIPKEDQ